jgi:hypothetical protein
MPNSSDLFDMRRLEALSNTIFGVAMTLLAYRVPTAQFLNGAPVWSTIWAAYHPQIVRARMGDQSGEHESFYRSTSCRQRPL